MEFVFLSLDNIPEFPWKDWPPLWSSGQEFLATDSEAPGSIPRHYKIFRQKKKKENK
jgi:hypothetical protein